jgi:predicted AlkP superfamily pyrophosphatase or phosphodiesterase
VNKTKGKSKQALRYLCLGLLLGLLCGQGCVSGIRLPQDQSAPAKPAADKVLFFVADGMRPDLMEIYARQRFMPTYSNLMDQGVRGVNGMIQAFPPNLGVGW